jgi:sialate O-acetylesterase
MRKIFSVMSCVAGGLLAAASAEFVVNGDFEDPAVSGNAVSTNVTGWTGTLLIDTTSDNNEVPGAPNNVIRLANNKWMQQTVSGSWTSNDVFTFSFNACEVYWKTAETVNAVWAMLRDPSDSTKFFSAKVVLDGTHGGAGVTYSEWQTNQIFSFEIPAYALMAGTAEGADGGATEGQDLKVYFYTTTDGDSINWIDNVSLTIAYGGPPPTLELASPFQDGMVLQRGKPVNVWGAADPTNEVSVSINGETAVGVSDADGSWMVELPALAAGGPYELAVVSGTQTVTLSDVLVGDVWITFGQSNMIRPLSEMTNKQTYIDDISTNRLIRCLEIAQDAALTPQDSGTMTWRDNSDPGSWGAVAAVFAHQMHAGSGVPTAVIWAAWGSSSIEGWMPIQLTNDFPHFDAMMDHYQSIDEYTDGDTTSSRLPAGYSSNLEGIAAMIDGTETWDDIFIRTRPNIIYNQRIHPLLNFGISGFVWYQGEANSGTAENAAQYGFTLPAFVTEYRELFGQGDLPFLGVQLPSYNSTYWAWFRESQNRVTALTNAYVAVTIDTGLVNNIHPYDKEPIGQRLALLGRHYVLGQSVEAHGPIFESMDIDGSEVTIGFSHASGLTTDDALDPAGFELAGADAVWYAATGSSVSGTDVILSSSSVAAPVAVRYAWSPAPVGEVNLVNSDGLPVAPFRTDEWAMPDLGAQAPMAVKDSYDFFTNAALVVPVPGILGNDIDLNRDALTASLVLDVAHGTLSPASDGSFSYTADDGYAGYDFFRYAVSDGALSATTTVTIAVHAADDAPTFSADVLYGASVYEGTAYSASLAGTAIGPDAMVFSKLGGPDWLAVAEDGSLSGTPGVSDAGTNGFSVEVSDGTGRTDTATLYIEVETLAFGFSDTFDDDGLDLNLGRGGGMATYLPEASKPLYFSDDGNLTGGASMDGAYRGAVYSLNAFAVTNGFKLDVTCSIITIDTTIADSATFGLVDEVGNLDGLFIDETKGITGIGMSLTTRPRDSVSRQGLNEFDADGAAFTSLSNAQVVTAGTGKTFSLIVLPDGSFSYSIDGAAPTTGTTAFDLTRDYHFAAYTQRNAQFAIQSVSLVPVRTVTAIGEMSAELLPGSTQMQFSWAGEAGGRYVLESTDDLVDGTWVAVTQVFGDGSPVFITEETDQTNAFYRVVAADE